MKRKFVLIILILVIGLVLINQLFFTKDQVPVISASSKMVDIRDGGILKKAAWRIVPDKKPDVYVTTNKNSLVTFYTDLDSISFHVKPKEKYRFIIVINGKDSALTEITYLPSYRETLKRAAKYNENDNRVVPKFTYESSNNPNLQSLRKHYKLDSIAGNGTELSRILNVLHWLHNLVPHNGQKGNPRIRNAESMIAVCKKENRGLNCRGLAIALNECYLSLGFKSRYVTCLPKDSLKIDRDCHVINMVYLNSQSKWIWIDPTFNAYVMNEKNEPLSIEEVRERIIEDKPLVLNSDANWNNQKPAVKEEYLFNYMAKNLYILSCPVVSGFDTETAYNDKISKSNKVVEYIKLLPLDYFKQKPDRIGIFYNTNNSKAFWARPD